nr:hypothetical protein [Tanacetum cinerariifolium]
MRSEQN